MQRVWRCCQLCDSQLRAGFGGAYAMDWGVVLTVTEDLSIERDDMFYRSLKVYEHALLKHVNKKHSGDHDG